MRLAPKNVKPGVVRDEKVYTAQKRLRRWCYQCREEFRAGESYRVLERRTIGNTQTRWIHVDCIPAYEKEKGNK